MTPTHMILISFIVFATAIYSGELFKHCNFMITNNISSVWNVIKCEYKKKILQMFFARTANERRELTELNIANVFSILCVHNIEWCYSILLFTLARFYRLFNQIILLVMLMYFVIIN